MPIVSDIKITNTISMLCFKTRKCYTTSKKKKKTLKKLVKIYCLTSIKLYILRTISDHIDFWDNHFFFIFRKSIY
jgi:hypothetical protein